MNPSSNLPIRLDSNSITSKLKKAGKITAFSLSTLFFTGATAATVALMPALAIPSTLGLLYSGQKLLNQTQFKSFPDLAFVVGKHGNKRKILQDTFTHPDLLLKLKDLSEPQKAGFMQLQVLTGLSKFEHYDKKGEKITYETNTHSIMKKTFETLEQLGYIENYQADYLKTSSASMILPRLALGNFKKAFTDKKRRRFLSSSISIFG